MNAFEKLVHKLRELFQLDQADLDFGIYRIMNQKREEIERFLTKDLLPQVTDAFNDYRQKSRNYLNAEIERLSKTLRESGLNPDDAPKIQELKAELAAPRNASALEDDVFSHLYAFFSRYYDNGDFLSLRRYKDGAYLIPYEGEEVKLHWANHDQYYIKTTENFTNYIVKLSDAFRLRFTVVNAQTEHNNNKPQPSKERRFSLDPNKPFELTNSELVLRFNFLPNEKSQKDLLSDTLTFLKNQLQNAEGDLAKLFSPAPTEKQKNRTLLEKHLSAFVAKNTFDYFIHKDLGGFLRRELDFYIKTEMLPLDDLHLENPFRFAEQLEKTRVMKTIALKLIAFLEQIETFQKRLWLKKKFVYDTHYLISFSKLPEQTFQKLLPQIVANPNQLDEWKRLYHFHYDPNQPLPKNLLLNTQYFPDEFTYALLAEFDDLDEETDGVLIHSENFQALNLLQERYREEIKCIYIDPPYNTAASEILYKNTFKHSSWLTFMQNRISISKRFMREDSVKIVAIDDTEFMNLSLLIEDEFVEYQRNVVVVNHHPAGAGLEGANISTTHEYAIFITPRCKKVLYGKEVEKKGIIGFIRTGTAISNLRIGRPNSFYAILVDPKTSKVIGAEKPPSFDEKYPLGNTEEGYLRIYPLGKNGNERVWRRSYESVLSEIKEENIIYKNKNLFLKSEGQTRYEPIFSNWVDKIFNAGVYGTNVLTNILGNALFSYPKSVFNIMKCIAISSEPSDTILDYFAGSGTTGHAVMSLNREDGGKRKFILVEMGDYFETVLKPRIMKVAYCPEWKEGKPIFEKKNGKPSSEESEELELETDETEKTSEESCERGYLFKAFRLESYEDALNNLELRRSREGELALEENASFREGYMLSYMLDLESRESLLNLKRFEHPFEQELKVTVQNELVLRKIDLVETFNYLIGLRVKSKMNISGFVVIEGRLRTGEKTLVIWRDVKEKDNDALSEFFLKQQYNVRDKEFDLIYVNGDNHLENLRMAEDRWKVRLIEEEFLKRMFEDAE